MRRKFLLKVMILSLLFVALGGVDLFAQTNLYVSSDYNSSTEGFGSTKFSNYAGAYAYATANATNATIVVEKTNTLSGNTFDNNHKNYSKLAVVIKDGATMGNALSKWDMTYPVTVEPGGTLTCARPKNASVSNIHIKNTLTVGAEGATKKAIVDFLSDTYQDCDISIRYNGEILVYNANFRVQDLDAQGSLTITDSDVYVDGAFASATFYATKLTNTEMVVNGNQINGGLSDFAGGTSNQLGKVTLIDSSITIENGDTKVAANVTATNSNIDVNSLTINSGKKLILNEGSALMAETIVNNGGTVTIDGVEATIEDNVLYYPVADFNALKAAVEAGKGVKLTADIIATGAVDGTDANIDLNEKTLTLSVGGNNFFGDSKVKNGSINITGCVASGDCIIGIGDYSNSATLTFDNVNVTGDGYSSAFAVLYVYNSSELNINGGSVVVSNDNASAGGVIKAHKAADGKINIVGTEGNPVKLTFNNAKIGMLDGTVLMNYVDLDITGGANAINQSALTIKNSTLDITGADGRALTLSQGDVVVENSTLNFSDCSEGEIRFKKSLELTTDNTSTINECTTYADASATDAKINGVDVDASESSMAVVTVENGTTTVKEAPQGNDFTGYTSTDNAIWGETWGNASASFVIKVLDANGNVMGTTSLNNIGGIIDGDVNVTWNIKLDAASNTDKYWTMEWTTAPTIGNMPAKVELWVDGFKVSGGNVVLNGPDEINKIYAAVTDNDGKILAYHTNVQEAIMAAAAVTGGARATTAGTVEFLADVTVDKWIMFSESLSIGNGQIITIEKIEGLTIDGNNHTLTINSIESAGNGNRLFYDATNLNIKDLTINYGEGVAGGIGLTSGTISNVTFIGGTYGVFPGADNVTVTGCTFNTNGTAIYFEQERDKLVVTGNTFELSDETNVILLRGDVTFTGNNVKSGRTVNVVSGSPEVTGNDFNEVRFKVYNAATATISGNTINNLVFNDETAVFSTFENNTLSEAAQQALENANFPVAQIGDVKYGTLAEAVAAAESGATITLLNGEHELPLFAGKELTFKGESKEGVIVNDAPAAVTQGWNGSTFHFENLTAKGATENYHGLANGVKSVTYKNCNINGLRFLYATEGVSFDGCAFNANGVEHSFWTYGASNVTVKNSTFTYTDRAVNCYSENGADHVLNITFTGCTFTYAGTNDAPEGAVEINSGSAKSFDIAFTGCTAPEKGAMWFNSQWDSKNGENTVVTIDGETVWQVPTVAKIGAVEYKSLQAAINAVQNGETITLLSDITENVTLTEKVGLYYTIDGSDKTMNGKITVNSLSDTNDNRRITISNINFVEETDANVDFISAVNTNHYPRLTVEGCTFTGSGNNGDVAIRLKSSHSVVINNCTGTKLHSFLQNTSGWNLTINEVTVTDSKGGLALGTVQGVTVVGCNVTTETYGIRLDADTYNNNAVIENCTVKAFIPVVVRKVNTESTITFEGTNTMTQTNTDGLWCAIGKGEYENNGEMPEAPATGYVTVTLNDTGLSMDGVYGEYFALNGEGTAESPYLINNLYELKGFRDLVDTYQSDGSNQFAGKYFKLTNDIDLSGINWDPIGTMNGDHGSFKGVFDGDDHTISNLHVEQEGNGIGLFARTAGNAVIKNLKLNNVTVKSTDNSNYVGGLVGNAYASTKIENVHVSGNVYISGRGYIGGIAGHGYVVMDNVSVVATGDGQGNTKGLITSTFWCAGGVLGYAGEGATNIMNAHVENVVVTSAAGGLGAIVGMAENNNGTQPISGSNLSAENVEIKTYTGAYGDSYANYALGYLYGGNPTSILTGELSVEEVTIETSTGEAPKVNDAVAQIGNSIYFNLQAALNAGGNVTVLRDIALAEGLTVAADKTVVLDLNGKTISRDTEAATSSAAITNNGNLTIKDSSEPSTGKVTAFAANPDTQAIPYYASNTITNCGVLTVLSGTIENSTGDEARAAYPIDNNSTSRDAIVTIEGGKVTGRGAIRQFANSTTHKNEVNVKGGEVSGSSYAIWVQNPGSGDPKSALNIEGGKLSKILISPSAEFDVAITGGELTEVAIWNADETNPERNPSNFISGGTFTQNMEEFCVEGYKMELNENGTYGVVPFETKEYVIAANGEIKTLADAIAKAKEDGTDIVTYTIYGAATLETGYSHGIVDFGGREGYITIKGGSGNTRSTDSFTITGGGVPDIKGVTFKDLTFYDEGDHLTTANEFMYQNFIDCTFENVKFEDGIRLSGNSVVRNCTFNANTNDEYAIWLDEGTFEMTGSTVTAGNEAYGLLKSDVVEKITISGNTFQYLAKVNKEALNVKDATIVATGNTFIDCAKGVVPTDKTNYTENGTTITNEIIAQNNTVVVYVAKIGDTKYQSLAAAVEAASNNATIQLLWAEGHASIAMAATIVNNKTVTITGTADVDWDKGWLYVGRNGEGNGKLIFNEANLTSKSVGSNSGLGLNVSCKKEGESTTNDGEVEIINSNIQLDYLIGKGNIKLNNSKLEVYEGFAVGARPASQTGGEQRTVTMDITNGSNVIVDNHNGQGLGHESNGIMNIDATSTFETKRSFKISANGTMNNAGTVEITGTLTNDGTINFKNLAAKLTAQEGLTIVDQVNNPDYKVVYKEGAYQFVQKVYVAQIGENKYESLQEAVNVGGEVTVLQDITLTEGIVILADKTVTLDLAGCTVKQEKAQTEGYAMITNVGTLTIKDSSNPSTGKLSYKDTGNGGEFTSSTIQNHGHLTILGGRIENLSSTTVATSGYPHAIDHGNYSKDYTVGDVTLDIQGGTISNAHYSAIRMFCNSTTYRCDATISGGTIENAIDFQLPNAGKLLGSLTITGGTFNNINGKTTSVRMFAAGNANDGTGMIASIEGGTFNGTVGVITQLPVPGSFNTKVIKGGKFSATAAQNTSVDLLAEGFAFNDTPDANGYYTVIQTSGTQTREFATPGWYWFSTYINLEGENGLNTLKASFNGNATQIKGQEGFTDYYNVGGGAWTAGLSSISAADMYMIKTKSPVTIELTGDFVEYEQFEIDLKEGWNWLGFPLSKEVNINDAFASFDELEAGDMIKGKDSDEPTAFYYKDQQLPNGNTFTGWLPEYTLKPGRGYMFKSSGDKEFVYSANSNRSSDSGLKTINYNGENHWFADVTKYPNNMSIVAMLSIDGEIVKDNYEVAAFANGECRGSARPIYIEALDAYMLFMTIQGEDVENLTFKYYDVNYGTEYELNNTMVYSNDAIVGTIEEPYMFNLGILNIDETSVDQISIYPNPTTTGKEINLQAMCDKVEVFNALGVKVAEYTNVDSIDALETAGIYVIRVTIDGNARNCRLIVK